MNYEYKLIKLEIADNIAVITLNDPDALNTFSLNMLIELTEAMEIIEDSSMGVRCLVMTGAGRAFSAGANLNDPARKPLVTGKRDSGLFLEKWYMPIFLRIADLEMPFLTAVNGAAAGVGVSFALAGDMILAARSAYFLQAFRRIGLIPDGGATYVIPRLIGKVRAMELMLLGERLPAEKALEWGMLNRVYDDEQLMPETMKLAKDLAEGPTRSLGMMRKLCWQGLNNTYIEQIYLERKYQRMMGVSEDHQEGVTAFKEKRPPKFRGR
jgi:2-(1,2-epoxy-1,2-dihydrophenyl)acetyl-CoA isomerase